MGLANVTKIHTPPSAERYFPLTPLVSMRCTKTISRSGMASHRKSLLTSRQLPKTAAPLLFANKSMPLGAIAVVPNTLSSELYVMRVVSFFFRN